VVFADADLDAAWRGRISDCFQPGAVLLRGQPAVRRGPVHDQFVEKVLTKAKAQKVGDPFDPQTTQGPSGLAGAMRPHHGLH